MSEIPSQQAGLRRGNTDGVGRKRNAVRGKLVDGAGVSTKYLLDILKWKAVIPVPDAKTSDGKQKFRAPYFREWQWAQEQCMKYGIGTFHEGKNDITSDGQPFKALIGIDLDEI